MEKLSHAPPTEVTIASASEKQSSSAAELAAGARTTVAEDDLSRSTSSESAASVRQLPLTLSNLEALQPPIALRPSAESVRHSVASVCGDESEVDETDLNDVVLEPANFQLKEAITAADLPTEAQKFSTLSDPQRIAELSATCVEGWAGRIKPDELRVKQIIAGLSNQLFQVSIRENVPNRDKFDFTDVLFRIYGADVHTLYDSRKEVDVFTQLAALGIAPRLRGTFEGGRCEEWISGKSLLAAHMGKRGVMNGVAEILSRLHCIELGIGFPGGKAALKRWEKEALRILRASNPGDSVFNALQALNLPRLKTDSVSVLKSLHPPNLRHPDTPLLKEGFCHCDIQPNNFLVTDTSLRLIDFEYAGLNCAAYDIAAYFWEMTCDYCVTVSPFYKIDDILYPSEERRRFFLANYLSRRLSDRVRVNDTIVTEGLDIVERFQLMNHLVWTYWSVIRSPQAPTQNDFDMLGYARRRLDVYWKLREKLFNVKEADDNNNMATA